MVRRQWEALAPEKLEGSDAQIRQLRLQVLRHGHVVRRQRLEQHHAVRRDVPVAQKPYHLRGQLVQGSVDEVGLHLDDGARPARCVDPLALQVEQGVVTGHRRCDRPALQQRPRGLVPHVDDVEDAQCVGQRFQSARVVRREPGAGHRGACTGAVGDATRGSDQRQVPRPDGVDVAAAEDVDEVCRLRRSHPGGLAGDAPGLIDDLCAEPQAFLGVLRGCVPGGVEQGVDAAQVRVGVSVEHGGGPRSWCVEPHLGIREDVGVVAQPAGGDDLIAEVRVPCCAHQVDDRSTTRQGHEISSRRHVLLTLRAEL